ncbi:Cna B-type domain-containing protein [Vagococcus lutrae]|uniref:Cna B-type domain-containing protein n=1 Tax=Vagococcus lutrae TaxID=81947 RepID=UPI00200ED547|nr:Cna B-type domain-containing protein [Vagococcus lutrae]UQF71471.1 Cna B-type domain-containing protein [Vagococcus lutrae]
MNKKRWLTSFMTLIFVIGQFVPSFMTLVKAQERFGGDDIITGLRVSPNDISHTQDFQVTVTFAGQSEDASGEHYIYPGKQIHIPITSDGVAGFELNSKLPEIENVRIDVTENGITLTFLEGIQGQHDISGDFTLTLSGLNTEEDSTHTLTVGNQTVNVSNTKGGDRGVFAGKTGMMYGAEKPGYVTWFLRGNINGDAYPGGPLVIHDKLGEGQLLDGSGIEIGLYWGGQQFQTHYVGFSSIEEFLASEYGTAAGSKIDYNMSEGTIDIEIPEEVLNGKEFAFTYDALITNNDLKEFTNKASFDFFEDQKPGHIDNEGRVINIDVGGNISGKVRAFLNINKVVAGTEIAIPGVAFEIEREDGGPLYQNKPETKEVFTTDEKGQIRASGFKPGKLLVREINAPDYVVFNPQEKQELNLVANNAQEIAVIENELKHIDIPVEKQWVEKAVDSVTVQLLANGKKVSDLELSADNEWQAVFENLPQYDAKTGEANDYTVEEVALDGYSSTMTGDMENGFTIVNTIEGKRSIGVTKEWVGPKAESVTIELLANGEKVSEITLSEDNNWQYVFTELDQYQDGEEIQYTVNEVAVLGYESTISGDMETGFKVVNTNVETLDIPVEKQWVGKAADSVTVQLLANGKKVSDLELSADNEWQAVFESLPQYDIQTGKAIDYTVEEVALDGYSSTMTGDMENGFTIVNTIEGKRSIGVTKEWVGPKAESVTIELLANGEKVSEITLSEDNNWQHVFTELDQYQDGEEIQYTVNEVAVLGYESTISGDMETGFKVVNTNVETLDIPVEKQWVGKVADSVTVQLLANGKKVSDLELSADNEWQAVFESLPQYDAKTGEAIDYRVEEVALDGYSSTMTGDMENGFTIVNTIEGKRSIGVTKEWVGPKAEQVTIELLANGKKVSEITLSEDNNWQHVFEKLDQYQDGEEIQYTVNEVAVPGYESTVSGDMEKGYTVTNTYVKEIEPEDPTTPEEPVKPAKPQDKAPKIEEKEEKRLPQTGESATHWLVWVGMMIVVTVFYTKRKYSYKNS